jgi:hypothetical protein
MSRADSERIINLLRPAWDAAAAGIAEAKAAGITARTREADAIDDDKAVAAWRPLAGHLGTLERIADVRMALTTMTGIGPTRKVVRSDWAHEAWVPMVAAFVPEVGDMTALSAAQKTFGLPGQRSDRGRWLTLGGLRLNTGPDADRLILAAEGLTASIGGGSVSCHERRTLDRVGHFLLSQPHRNDLSRVEEQGSRAILMAHRQRDPAAALQQSVHVGHSSCHVEVLDEPKRLLVAARQQKVQRLKSHAPDDDRSRPTVRPVQPNGPRSDQRNSHALDTPWHGDHPARSPDTVGIAARNLYGLGSPRKAAARQIQPA